MDFGDVGKSIFVEDLCCFEDERDALSHAFDLEVSMLFEDQFAEEESLVESRLFANAVDVVLVELGCLSLHNNNQLSLTTQ